MNLSICTNQKYDTVLNITNRNQGRVQGDGVVHAVLACTAGIGKPLWIRMEEGGASGVDVQCAGVGRQIGTVGSGCAACGHSDRRL